MLTRVTFEGGNVEHGGAALQMRAVEPSHPSGAQVELVDCKVVSNDSAFAAAYVFGNTGAGETVATLISKNTDWGSAAASNDNTIADVMFHEVSIENTRESYSGKASFTCTLSPRKCTVD